MAMDETFANEHIAKLVNTKYVAVKITLPDEAENTLLFYSPEEQETGLMVPRVVFMRPGVGMIRVTGAAEPGEFLQMVVKVDNTLDQWEEEEASQDDAAQ